MARNKSILKFEGTVGGLVFYTVGGQERVRTTPNVSKERRKTDPAYKPVRERNSEFGGSSRASIGFKNAFRGVLKSCGEGSVGVRNNAYMLAVLKLSGGLLGQRDVDLVQYGFMLQGFELHKNSLLANAFTIPNAKPVVSLDRNALQWTVGDFDTKVYVKAPAGATHFKLVLAGGFVSNYQYDEISAQYEPVNNVVNGEGGVDYSSPIDIGGMVGSDTVLDVDLSAVATNPGSCVLVGGVGILFFQKVNGEMLPLAERRCMRVEVVG